MAISRLDSYGESLYQMDPYLHIGIRQTLPKFGPGRWQAIADCDNILAQGYVTLNTPGWTNDAGSGISHVPRWFERSVLKTVAVF